VIVGPTPVYIKGGFLEKLRQNLFSVNWDSLFLTDDIELITNEITNAILNAAESSIPTKIVTIRKGGQVVLFPYHQILSYHCGELGEYSYQILLYQKSV
jgi:hypothetical protein